MTHEASLWAGHRCLPAVALTLLLAAGPLDTVYAGEADVVEVSIASTGANSFRIDATLAHADEGWDHYADQWQVFTLDGQLLGTRELLHPHVDEQPFTRSLSVSIPTGVKRIRVVAHDSVHGTGGGQSIEVDVPHGA